MIHFALHCSNRSGVPRGVANRRSSMAANPVMRNTWARLDEVKPISVCEIRVPVQRSSERMCHVWDLDNDHARLGLQRIANCCQERQCLRVGHVLEDRAARQFAQSLRVVLQEADGILDMNGHAAILPGSARRPRD